MDSRNYLERINELNDRNKKLIESYNKNLISTEDFCNMSSAIADEIIRLTSRIK